MFEKSVSFSLTYSVESGDVTITRSGANFGQTSVIGIELDEQEIYACADLLVLRSPSIDGYLVSTYLNSSVGKRLLNRGAYGGAQPHIAPTYIREIPFPEYLVVSEKEISELVKQSRILGKQAERLYTQAQHLLESELGLDKLNFQKHMGYTTSASELMTSFRTDAEYYDPIAIKIINKITALDHSKLKDSFHVGSGFPWKSSKFLPNNSGEPVVRIRNIKPSHIDSGELTSIETHYVQSIAFPKAKRGDIVIGMDGIKYFYGSVLEGECYVNQRVCHLTPRNSGEISSEYAVFIVNSRVGQAQLMRDMTVATTVGHITNRDIAKLVVPTVSKEFHDKITELVRSSIDAKEESKRLLQQAKNRVEQLIEEAVKS